MPVPTPFHARTTALCTSLRWKEWAGCFAVCSYDVHHDREYQAFRHSTGLLDVTPLFKYELSGRDAAAFLAWLTVKDVTKLAIGRVAYACWCDERGKVLDDGTIARIDDQRFRLTSADPSYAWLVRNARGFEVEIVDVSRSLAALAVQGPTSRATLQGVCDADLDRLRFFGHARTAVAGVPIEITRTGYTGDLGFELWIPAERALPVWDAVVDAGRAHGLEPAGLDALDVVRHEAGFILMGVDYKSARRCLTEAQTSSPYEIGLGWTVDLEREDFLGRDALAREAQRGSTWQLVELESDWNDLEALYESFDLPIQLASAAWRSPVPVYSGLQQVGYATSGAWSPTCKKNLALATVRAEHAALGSELALEATVEFERRRVRARVVARPQFDPERKRSCPGAPPKASARAPERVASRA